MPGESGAAGQYGSLLACIPAMETILMVFQARRRSSAASIYQ